MTSSPYARLPLLDDLGDSLQTRSFGRIVRGYTTIDSTNTAAMAWAMEGVPEGSVVVAEHQTAGRGRLGRRWQDAAGKNLLFSIVLRPALPASHLGLLTLAAGIAVAETVASFAAPFVPMIKWPNDVLLEDRKCCGMLLEATLNAPTHATVVLGIGLNVNQDVFPESLEPTATSLLLQLGRPVPRGPLLAALLQHLERYYASLHEDQGATVLQAYETRLQGIGHPITLRYADQHTPVAGVLQGITDTGALRLETPEGPRTFHAGEVTTQQGL